MALQRIFLMGAMALLPLTACAGGDPAAPVLKTALAGLDGRVHRIDDWKGKIRLVNFWATWCAPCRSEIPLLAAVREEWRKRGVEVIGVAVDGADEVRSFDAATKIGFPILLAPEQGQALMQSGGNAYGALPFTLLLDRNGKVVQRHAGALDVRRLQQWLEEVAAAH